MNEKAEEEKKRKVEICRDNSKGKDKLQNRCVEEETEVDDYVGMCNRNSFARVNTYRRRKSA